MEIIDAEWGVDLAVTGSQKGLMLPAGPAIVCASPRALSLRADARCARVFFDFGDMALGHGQRDHDAARGQRRRGDRCRLPALRPRARSGLARMAGKLFRIGHLGDLNELMLLGAVAGAEMAMRDVGVEPGSGVAAAQEHYRATAAPLVPLPGAPGSPDARRPGAGSPDTRAMAPAEPVPVGSLVG